MEPLKPMGCSLRRFIGGVKHGLLILIACFFLYFGIAVLHGAYQLNDPFTFILTFFASNLMILISAALLIAFLLRAGAALGIKMRGFRRKKPSDPSIE